MSQSNIIKSIDGAVVTLQFNRADKKNAITADMYQLLADGLNDANKDPSVKLVKIIGADNAFCAGNDLSDFLKNPPHEDDNPVWQFLFALDVFEKPLIAGVNGPAVGIGTTLLLHCDLVAASSSAVFALPFTALGLSPEAASSLLIPKQCGLKKATEWLMLGERFNAAEAEKFGLINCALETPEQVSEQIEKWQAKLLKLPFESVMATRQLLRQVDDGNVKARMTQEGDIFKRLLKSDAAQAAFQAFLNR